MNAQSVKVVYSEISKTLVFQIPEDATCDDLLKNNIVNRGILPFDERNHIPISNVVATFVPPVNNLRLTKARTWASKPGATVILTPNTVDKEKLMHERSYMLTDARSKVAILTESVKKLQTEDIPPLSRSTSGLSEGDLSTMSKDEIMKILIVEAKKAEQDRKALQDELKKAEQDRKKAEQDRKTAEQDRKALQDELKKSEQDRKAFQAELKKAEDSRNAIDSKYSSLLANRENLLRRILLDYCKEKLNATVPESSSSSTATRVAALATGLTEDQVRMIYHSETRHRGNVSAHQASAEEIARVITSMDVNSTMRLDLSSLFTWYFGVAPENIIFDQ
jgi:hypothetical protein